MSKIAIFLIAIVIVLTAFYIICALMGFDWLIRNTFCRIGLHERFDLTPPAKFMPNCIYCGH